MSELGTPILFIDVDPGQAEFSVPGLEILNRKNIYRGTNFFCFRHDVLHKS